MMSRAASLRLFVIGVTIDLRGFDNFGIARFPHVVNALQPRVETIQSKKSSFLVSTASTTITATRGGGSGLYVNTNTNDSNEPNTLSVQGLNEIQKRNDLIYSSLWLIPLISAVTAFRYFAPMSNGFHSFIRSLSTWTNTKLPETEVEIDLQTQVVTQVVNGPVITSISLLFATMIAMTISTLHARQMTFRKAFTIQMECIRLLKQMLPSPQLVTQLEEALHYEAATENELMTVDSLLVALVLQAKTPEQQNLLSQIQQHRSELMLQAQFPKMHYITLGLLGFSICLTFFIATDQDINILTSVPVRLLWTILVGAFSSLGVVCFDLARPFTGVYRIPHPS